MLGIGTVGYTYILEKAGLRFRYVYGAALGPLAIHCCSSPEYGAVPKPDTFSGS